MLEYIGYGLLGLGMLGGAALLAILVALIVSHWDRDK